MNFIEWLKVILLGIVEGITEWLPISSTGHLILTDAIWPLQQSDAFKEMFNVVIQLGAILAVVVLYWSKLWPFHRKRIPQRSWFAQQSTNGFVGGLQRFGDRYCCMDKIVMWLKIAVSCLPAMLIGLPLNDWLDKHFYNPTVVALMLLLYGAGFLLVERYNRSRKPRVNSIASLRWSDALLIGVFQVLALIPGTSRSGATILGGILIGNALTGGKMTREDMLTMATVLEGHPDNVAPAIYGGLSVSIMVDGKTLTNSIPIDDDLSFITVSPEVEVSTEEARKALPKTIDYQSAVFNVSRVSFLVSSLFTKQYDRIAYGLQDKLHVPYRLRLIPSGELVLKKAVEAGALGATISGSGSTLIAFATDREVQIMDAMVNCFNDHGIAATGHILKCSNEGAKLVE